MTLCSLFLNYHFDFFFFISICELKWWSNILGRVQRGRTPAVTLHCFSPRAGAFPLCPGSHHTQEKGFRMSATPEPKPAWSIWNPGAVWVPPPFSLYIPTWTNPGWIPEISEPLVSRCFCCHRWKTPFESAERFVTCPSAFVTPLMPLLCQFCTQTRPAWCCWSMGLAGEQWEKTSSAVFQVFSRDMKWLQLCPALNRI